ncbi:hypothetical protein [Primorskyibacter flagellatus]|uniref:phosphorylase family protein n=1 Tax=Primorskyibacter flagellatus TaxID=1387277 RepID=UPI003A930EAD
MSQGGTYLIIKDPQFSTRRESRIFAKAGGADVIGMTNMPEARFARETLLCYASAVLATDYERWHPEHGEVNSLTRSPPWQVKPTTRASRSRDCRGSRQSKLPALMAAAKRWTLHPDIPQKPEQPPADQTRRRAGRLST